MDKLTHLELEVSGERIQLDAGKQYVVSRSNEKNDKHVISVQSSLVSTRHCLLEAFTDSATVIDLSSEFGTFLNGKALRSLERAKVFAGDKLEFGKDSGVAMRVMRKQVVNLTNENLHRSQNPTADRSFVTETPDASILSFQKEGSAIKEVNKECSQNIPKQQLQEHHSAQLDVASHGDVELMGLMQLTIPQIYEGILDGSRKEQEQDADLQQILQLSDTLVLSSNELPNETLALFNTPYKVLHSDEAGSSTLRICGVEPIEREEETRCTSIGEADDSSDMQMKVGKAKRSSIIIAQDQINKNETTSTPVKDLMLDFIDSIEVADAGISNVYALGGEVMHIADNNRFSSKKRAPRNAAVEMANVGSLQPYIRSCGVNVNVVKQIYKTTNEESLKPRKITRSSSTSSVLPKGNEKLSLPLFKKTRPESAETDAIEAKSTTFNVPVSAVKRRTTAIKDLPTSTSIASTLTKNKATTASSTAMEELIAIRVQSKITGSKDPYAGSIFDLSNEGPSTDNCVQKTWPSNENTNGGRTSEEVSKFECQRSNFDICTSSNEEEEENKLEELNGHTDEASLTKKPTNVERKPAKESRANPTKKPNAANKNKENNSISLVRHSRLINKALRDLQPTTIDENALLVKKERTSQSKMRSSKPVPINPQLLPDLQPLVVGLAAAENKSAGSSIRRSRRLSLQANCKIGEAEATNTLDNKYKKEGSTLDRRRSERCVKKSVTPKDPQPETMIGKKAAKRSHPSKNDEQAATSGAAGIRRSKSVGALFKEREVNRSPEIERQIAVARNALSANAIASFNTKRLRRVSFGDELQNITNKPTIKVMTTLLDIAQIKKLTDKSAGLSIVTDSAMDADVLVMEKGIRTFKFLIAVARGIPIVTSAWLSAVNKQKAIVDTTPYILKSPAFEAKYEFAIENAIKWASQHKIFEGLIFMMTTTIQPEPEKMKMLITSAGGKVHTQIVPAFQTVPGQVYLVSHFADINYWRQYMEGNRFTVIIHPESVIEAILHQNASKLNKFQIH